MNIAQWIYKFFKDIDKYIAKAKDVESIDISDGLPSACTSFSRNWESKLKINGTAENICVKCIKLYDSLDYINKTLPTDTNYKKDCEFLNVWLNLKLYNNVINETDCVSMFYDELEAHCAGDCLGSLSDFQMYNIKNDDLDKMKILYNLHYKRSEIRDLIDTASNKDAKLLLEPSTLCFNEYRIAASKCNNKDSKFCKLLENFKNEYEKLYPVVETKSPEFLKNFKRLSGDENNKIISTAVTGSIVGLIPLVGILYKYTPMGQLLKPNKGKVMDGQIYNGKDMRNISLMDQENEPSTFQQGTYNIKYQSA
ncbi:variable surface protein Vir30, putative [Plasmodium vivax]|uniref:Variable surface protein Vir30, putative n=1 Tax=Plasmodium vivax (strain Salvador I) TaxID=126793 RepID=A5KDA5_PLAVS|nr:variable surface protein Vir30, putative [Plasmodium vivax]EDL42664.1 variable surface protein Vir30, putative [Plasmodium vivax]|eukprot:XP_001612457.1 variable surface protein Vir30 [Plasmodium vivax Sal-1]